MDCCGFCDEAIDSRNDQKPHEQSIKYWQLIETIESGASIKIVMKRINCIIYPKVAAASNGHQFENKKEVITLYY